MKFMKIDLVFLFCKKFCKNDSTKFTFTNSWEETELLYLKKISESISEVGGG